MSILGKLDAAITGVVIFGMGLAAGWTLNRSQMPVPDKNHGVFCIVKGASVICRLTPPDPDWYGAK